MISIIVPIYNVENYLGACIESILNSTYKDFELILVDDGSTDGCGAICDRFAEQDKRVKVVHKQNGGLSDARNSGLKVAKGEFIGFVDGDDMIHPRMFEVLYDAINSGDYDFSMALGKKVPEGFSIDTSQELISTDKEFKTKEFEQYDFISGIFSIDDKFISVWNKLYRKERITDLWFEYEGIGEDLEWNTRFCLSRMRRAIFVNSYLYYYRLRKGSAIRSGITPKVIDGIRVYTKCLDYVPKDNRSYRAIVLKGIFTFMLQIRRKSVNTSLKKEAERVCSEIYNENIDEFFRSDIGWFSKMRSIFGYKYPGTYNFIVGTLEFIVTFYYKLIGRNY